MKFLNNLIILVAGVLLAFGMALLLDGLTFRSTESSFVLLVVSCLVVWRYLVAPALREVDRRHDLRD